MKTQCVICGIETDNTDVCRECFAKYAPQTQVQEVEETETREEFLRRHVVPFIGVVPQQPVHARVRYVN